MSVELSFVLPSFFQDRLGSSFKVLPLLWDIPDIFPLTQTNWCDSVTFCTNPSVPASSPSLPHYHVLVQLHCFAAIS